MTTEPDARVDLYWLPLGAGGHSVRINGRIYEAVAARIERRQPLALYHSALQVEVDGERYAIEQGPALNRMGNERGVVAEGPVGARVAGRLRLFRYEVRVWRGGLIPDIAEAVDSPRSLGEDAETARRVLAVAPRVPTYVWGRDQLGAGEMWNSNSVIAWILGRIGLDVSAITPPLGGRAPGWRAGVLAAGEGVEA